MERSEWYGSKRLKVVNALSGAPVEGAHASVLVFKGDDRDIRAGTVDRRGEVELDEFHVAGPDRYTYNVALMVRKRGYVTTLKWLDYGSLPAAVSLTSGTPVRGTVVLADGHSAAGARVYAWDEDTREEIARETCSIDPYFADFISVDGRGRFEIDGVAPGRSFILCVVLPGYGVYRAVHEAQPDISIRLGDGGTIEGRVFNARGIALANADVYVEPEQADGDCDFGLVTSSVVNTRTVTDAEGRYRVVGVPVPGRYVVTASMGWSARGASEAVEFLGGNRWRWRDVTVEECARLRVRLAAVPDDHRGMFWVSLRHLDGSSSWSRFWSNSSTWSDGTYSRDGIHAGTYRLRVKLDHGLVDAGIFDLRPGETLKVVIPEEGTCPVAEE